ncbi:transcriptional regulator [Candidatus Woesearchaeota archaeon]|nr:transcriptional regulator [Candidatus Woesearchaeota archaeon]
MNERILRVLGKDTVWLILEQLGKGNTTPTELAKKLDMSVANIDNFMSKLEDLGIVKKVKKIRKGRGRPFTEYSLDKAPVFIIIPSKGKKICLKGDEYVIKEVEELAKRNKGETLG